MNQFEFEAKIFCFSLKRMAAFILCLCMLLASSGTQYLASTVKNEMKQESEVTQADSIDATGYSFVTPDTITPDVWCAPDKDFYAMAISNTSFNKKIGDSVEMKVYAWSKSGTLQYTWYAPNGEELEGITGDTLKIESLTDEDSFGRYQCVVSDGLPKNSTRVYFRVGRETRLFVTKEQNTYWPYIGEDVTLKVNAVDYSSEEQNLTYQWYKGSKPIQGETKSELTFKNTEKQGKNSTYKCVVSNGKESVSNNFTIYSSGYYYAYYDVIEIKNSSDTKYCKTNDEVTLTVDAESKYFGKQLTYQWYKGNVYYNGTTNDEIVINTDNAEIIEGETNDSFTFVVDSSTNYSCVISDGYYKSIYSQFISANKDSVSVYIYRTESENSCTLSSNVTLFGQIKESDLSYQWYKVSDQVNTDEDTGKLILSRKKEIIPDATEKDLFFETITENDLGEYTLEISWETEETEETVEAAYTLTKKYFSIKSSSYAIYQNDESSIVYTAAEGYTDRQLENASYQWYVVKPGEEKQQLPGETERELTADYTENTINYEYICDIIINGITCSASFHNNQIQRIDENSTDWAVSCTNTGVKTIYYNRKYDTETIQLDPGIVKGTDAHLTYTWEQYIPGNQYPEYWEDMEYDGESYELDMDEFDDNSDFRVRVIIRNELNETKIITFVVSQEKTLYMDYEQIETPISGISGFSNSSATNTGSAGNPYTDCYLLGDSITMHCKAMSTEGEILYQWEKLTSYDGDYEPIEGAVSADYTIQEISYDDYGSYRCMVTDGNQIKWYHQYLWQGYLNITTDSFLDSKLLYPGAENISINIKEITLSGQGENLIDQCQYQWYKYQYNYNSTYALIEDSDHISGSKTSTLTFNTILPEDYGYYMCEVTYKGHTFKNYSTYIYWSGRRWKNLSTWNQSFTGEIGESIYLYTEVDAPEECISYQWYHNNTEISGATDSYYLLRLNKIEDFGNFYCKITVNGYSCDGLYARITQNNNNVLNVLAKEHYLNYKNKRLAVGDTINMGAIAYTTGNSLSYQWQVCTGYNPETGYIFQDIPNATQPDYPLTIQSENDYGTYRCIVSCPDLDMEKYVLYGIYPPKAGQASGSTDKVTNNQPSSQTIAVTSVALNKSSLEIEKGKQAMLTATVSPTNATNKTITWSSSNPNIATVTNGTVKGIKQGSAIITVSTADGAKTASCSVKVTIPSTIVMLLNSMSLVKGESCKLKPTMTPSNSTDSISWNSSNANIATVSSAGNVTAIAAGTTKITATASSGKKATCTIYVVRKKIPATKVKLNKNTVTMQADGILQLQATMTPQKSTSALTWKSSNTKIAQVDANGVVTPKRAGTVKITVKTASGKKDVCKISIKQNAQSVSLNKKSLTIKINNSFQLKAKMKPSYATDRLKWKTSNKKIVSVTNKGKITGRKKGKATITVTTSSGPKATCKVTVK